MDGGKSLLARLIPKPASKIKRLSWGFPELNLVEHVWEKLRVKYLPNKAFKSLDGVEHALCEGLRGLHGDPHRASSMTSFP
jgi:hypothetical protein